MGNQSGYMTPGFLGGLVWGGIKFAAYPLHYYYCYFILKPVSAIAYAFRARYPS